MTREMIDQPEMDDLQKDKEKKEIRITVTMRDFERLFCIIGKGYGFSYEGLVALYNYLKENERWVNGRRLNLTDIISVFSGFREYENFADFANDYGEYKSIEEIKRDFYIVIPIDKNRFLVKLPEVLW